MATCLAVLLPLLLFLALQGTAASRGGIVGGREAKPHSRPYMASLQSGGRHFCGGVLVRQDFVLTAAHCYGASLVVLGAHSLSSKEPSKQELTIQRYIRHPAYDSAGFNNDLMLLKLAGRANLTREVQLIPLMREQVTPRSACSTAGWGDVVGNETFPDRLQEVEAKVVYTKTCKKKWHPFYNITKSMLCATGPSPSVFQGFCWADSGGPLVCNGMSAGVVSFSGPSCADPRTPDVYMRVSAYLPWIQEVINNN